MEMLKYWWKNYNKMRRAAKAVFGIGKPYVFIVIGNFFSLMMDRLFNTMDHFLFPSFLEKEVEQPVFIIGHPRSGTTFLHRFLHRTNEFVSFRFWEIMFPSLTARKLLAFPMQRMIDSGKNVILPPETGHEQNLESIEEEELLFFKYLNTQLILPMTPLAFSEETCDDLIFPDLLQSETLMRETMGYLRKCFQKQMVWTNKRQVVANMNYSAMRLRGILKEFPDAKIIYLIRSPYETIASHLSLHYHVLDYQWGIGNIPRDKMVRYFEQRYRYNVAYYHYVDNLIEDGILDGKNMLPVKYDAMQRSFQEMMHEIFNFLGISMNNLFQKEIEKQAEVQKRYRSVHQNLELDSFGLCKNCIAQDLEPIFRRYQFPIS